MVIDSVSFIFWLLPVFLLFFALAKEKFRKPLILCISLFVCSWGSLKSLILLLGFIICNWALGRLIAKKSINLYLAIGFDIAFLCMFKYVGISDTIPLGISYYVLSGISYCIDIYRDDVIAWQSLYNTAFYLAFFPKLIMGPFVKYKDFESQIDFPHVNAKNISDGMFRFSIGLAKKLAIAGTLADVTTKCWEDAPFSTASAWIGLICFSLQLYYDFSGYSDMAIGLASICGFEIKENFDHPYQAGSLKEFWAHWHISLGEWFKDYLYFPLGGNRKGETRTYVNLLIVWLATALWHGIGLNFILWGLFLCIFIVLEKKFADFFEKIPRGVRIVYTDFIVVMGWVFFNAGSAVKAFAYFGYLFGNAAAASDALSALYFSRFFDLIAVAIIGVTALPKTYSMKIFEEEKTSTIVFKCIFVIALLSISTASIVVNGYTPFIYTGF